MELVDSRRLTGANLFWERPGAVIDVSLGFMVVHRVVARFLIRFEAIGDPIFAHVDPDNPNAVRWTELLGLETRRTEVFPDNRRMLRVQRYAV